MADFRGPPPMADFPAIGETPPRQIVADMLGIEDSDAWGITDTMSTDYGTLVMIRYKRGADKDRYGKLNGIVIHLEARAVVCRSYGHAPIVVADQVTVNDQNQIVLTDILGNNHTFDARRVKFKRGTEGTILRVFRWGGQTIICSHTKFDVSASQWGSSPPFLDIYRALGGPMGDDLFHPETVTSPICHLFSLVHPDLMVASKQDVGVGYLNYIGPKQMWPVDVIDCPYKQTDAQGLDADGVPFHPVGQMPEDWLDDPRPNAGYLPSQFMVPAFVSRLSYPIQTPVTLAQRSFSALNPDDLYRVNNHLKNGYWQPPSPEIANSIDPRLTPGEFLTMYVVDADQQLEEIAVQIMSSAYYWRKEFMRGDSPHLWTRLMDLLNNMYVDTTTPDGFNRFVGINNGMLTVSGFPLMQSWSVESIIASVKSGPMIIWPVFDSNGQVQVSGANVLNGETEDDRRALRVYNIWAAFIMAVPLSQQMVVADLYYEFYNRRAELIEFTVERAKNGDYKSQELGNYFDGHIGRARARAQKAINEGNNKTEDGSDLDFDQLVEFYVKQGLMNEKTNVIRKMLRIKKTIEITEEREKQQAEEAAAASAAASVVPAVVTTVDTEIIQPVASVATPSSGTVIASMPSINL